MGLAMVSPRGEISEDAVLCRYRGIISTSGVPGSRFSERARIQIAPDFEQYSHPLEVCR
jgi:hypothetical protein